MVRGGLTPNAALLTHQSLFIIRMKQWQAKQTTWCQGVLMAVRLVPVVTC